MRAISVSREPFALGGGDFFVVRVEGSRGASYEVSLMKLDGSKRALAMKTVRCGVAGRNVSCRRLGITASLDIEKVAREAVLSKE